MSRVQKYLPDFCYSPKKIKKIEGIVVHYFSGKYQFSDDPFNLDKCFDLFVDLNRPANEREWFKMEDVPNRMYASAHFLIGRDGTILDLVPITNKAWHAGKSEWNGRSNCNDWMIGIEMVATHDSGYTDEQYESLSILTRELIAAFEINWNNITGHENVAPGRKSDPGPEFDWDRFKRETEETGNDFSDNLIWPWRRIMKYL